MFSLRKLGASDVDKCPEEIKSAVKLQNLEKEITSARSSKSKPVSLNNHGSFIPYLLLLLEGNSEHVAHA